MKTIIIDDEKHCSGTLEILLKKYCPSVEQLAVCQNGEEGIQAIRKYNPDLIFLDIEMPRMNGFEMLSQIENPSFEIIFTTAYDNFAIKAFKVSAIDYLLKPIDKNELILGVEKAESRIQKPEAAKISLHKEQIDLFLENIKESKRPFPNIALPTLAGLEMIRIHEIMYIESDGNYCKLFMSNQQQLVVSKTLKEMEQLLELHNFIRIHHSYLVNAVYIRRYVKGDGGYIVLKNEQHLNVSRRKKEDLIRILKGY